MGLAIRVINFTRSSVEGGRIWEAIYVVGGARIEVRRVDEACVNFAVVVGSWKTAGPHEAELEEVVVSSEGMVSLV